MISALCLWALLSAGCAGVPLPTVSDRIGEGGALGSCANFFASLDDLTEKAGVFDPGVFRVRHYPYLRVNRFVASFRADVDQPAAFAAWLDRMQALDRDARRYEIANLPDPQVASLDPVNGRDGLRGKVAGCGDLLRKADFSDDDHRRKLRQGVSAPDEYIVLRRVLGIYPLTSLFVSRGVSQWHISARKGFSTRPPLDWRALRYAPASRADGESVRQVLAQAKRDALGIPVYSDEERNTLLNRYAPVWEIQANSGDDRIGTPIWSEEGRLDVDTGRPLTYTLISFTRFGKQVLTQLNYVIWFPSRPREGYWDLYGGLLDGLNYRVTLDGGGTPLLYETVHNCGCYYKAYPTKGLKPRAETSYAEPPLILDAPDADAPPAVVTVAMESRTHYVRHLYSDPRPSPLDMQTYALADYDRLRSLPVSGSERRSMFDRYALAPGSERLERFILWPTGVLSPGGMRQWGRHAVAFVGKRHFDDPFYMDKMFVEIDSRPQPECNF